MMPQHGLASLYMDVGRTSILSIKQEVFLDHPSSVGLISAN